MTRKEATRINRLLNTLSNLGISYEDGEKLRRVSNQLRSWYEKECGIEGGCIERDEDTDKPYWLNSNTGKRWAIGDREKGAKRRLAAIMAKYPDLTTYLQSDPRGAALYILRPQDIIPGEDLSTYYSRGICVY